jgi:hypothetical protein
MSKITLNKGQFYKLKQHVYDTGYVVICPSRNFTLKEYCDYDAIPSLFKVTGYGKRKKLHPYSTYRIEKGKLIKYGWVFNVIIYRQNYRTIKPLSIKDCIQLNILLRENSFVFNKKVNKLIQLR